jgi:hypothetical protein
LVTVFVVKEDLAEYQKTLNPYWYGRIVVGELGIIPQREFIQQFYPLNTNVVSLDDDIEYVDLSMTPYKTLDEFIKSAFEECRRRNAYIWGVYPVYNPFFRVNRIPVTYNLSFIIGAFYGYITRPNPPRLELTREGNKDDVEMSLLYYERDGIVVRFNKVGFKTKMYGNDGGGLGKFKDRLEIMERLARAIHQKYPTVTRIKVRRNGMTEIVLAKDI